MLGLKRKTLTLIPYCSEWRTLYAQEAVRLEEAIGSFILDIQHVGSTSMPVPGMVAKPILDIAVRVGERTLVEACREPLAQLGYEYRGEQGIVDRHLFAKGDPRTHHLHMMLPQCSNWENQVVFRDYLLQHPETALAYAELKLELAEELGDNREAYTAGKAPFIEDVLQRARLSS